MTNPLAVIMPAYNEEGAIRDAVEDVRDHVMSQVPGATLIVVNDGSRDDTGTMLDQLAEEYSWLRVVHKQNAGHGPALITGLQIADADSVLLVDSDRQIKLDDFGQWWTALSGGADAVFGVREARHDPAMRLALTRIVRWSIRLLFGVSIRDANVPCKLFKMDLWNEAQRFIPADTLAPSLLLAIAAHVRGSNIVEVVVPHRERMTGEVSIKRLRLLRFCARAFGQMITFRRELRRAR